MVDKTISRKILFIISEDWYFASHRLHLAIQAIESGYTVALLSNYSKYRNEIENRGIKVIDWSLSRSSKNPFRECLAIRDIILAIRQFQPDLIHSVAMKPVLYSAIASRFSRTKVCIFALAGLGFIFSSEKHSAKFIRPIIQFAFRLLCGGQYTRFILQNPEDKSLLLAARVVNHEHVRLIRGAGVDTNLFKLKPLLMNIPIVILPSRMLWAKGIRDFIDCAKEINKNGVKARFVLVGDSDLLNPDAIPINQLKQWDKEGTVEWWGHRDNMIDVLQQSRLVCLPTTYGEGLPKVLLEAASCGRPIVTFDVPGCREIVKDGYNGYLVQPKSIDSLVEAIILLINNYKLCIQMGENGRRLVKKHFTQEKIAQETMAVWEEVLAS